MPSVPKRGAVSTIAWGGLLAASLIAVPGTAVAQRAPGGAQAGAAAAGGAALPYRINPGDELEVYVWGEERLQRVIRVLPDGTFSFPLVGQINALGRLPTEVERLVSQGLASQFREGVPQVTVSVRNPAGLQFSVVGKVRTPGTFTPGRYVNALEALSFAGGATEFANLGQVVIIRKEGGRLSSTRVRLGDALRGSPSALDLDGGGIPLLRAGDTVVVP